MIGRRMKHCKSLPGDTMGYLSPHGLKDNFYPNCHSCKEF